MKITDHHIRYLKFIRRKYELVCPAIKRLKISGRRYRTFQRPHNSCANSTYPPLFILCLIDYRDSLVGDPYPFRINLMLCEIFHIHTPEIPESDMQSYLSKLHTDDLKLFQQLTAEMQAGCRSRYSSFMLCKNRLISLIILRLHLTVYKLGKGCLAQAVECLLKLFICTVIQKSQRPASRCCIINDLCDQEIIFTEIEFISD